MVQMKTATTLSEVVAGFVCVNAFEELLKSLGSYSNLPSLEFFLQGQSVQLFFRDFFPIHGDRQGTHNLWVQCARAMTPPGFVAVRHLFHLLV